MKKKLPLLFFLLVVAIDLQAQLRHTLYLNTGYTFNQSFELNGSPVDQSRGMVLTAGGLYQVYSFKNFFSEIGLAGKTILATGKINGDSFYASTLRLAVPTRLGVHLSNNWAATGSFVFQNNVDFKQFDFKFRDKYSWRVDFLAEAQYQLNERWYLTAGMSFNLRKIPDAFFINDPQTAILIGLAKRVNLPKRSKNKP